MAKTTEAAEHEQASGGDPESLKKRLEAGKVWEALVGKTRSGNMWKI